MTLAPTIAVIAVARVGFGMLSWWAEFRRSVTVVLGCFAVFGAPTIAAELMSAVSSGADQSPTRVAVASPAPS